MRSSYHEQNWLRKNFLIDNLINVKIQKSISQSFQITSNLNQKSRNFHLSSFSLFKKLESYIKIKIFLLIFLYLNQHSSVDFFLLQRWGKFSMYFIKFWKYSLIFYTSDRDDKALMINNKFSIHSPKSK